jgi:hypothetical protein
VKRGDREIKRMPLGHPWSFQYCNCGKPATHLCAKHDHEFAVACEWHAHRWVREA